jgi:hypothetical protein
MTPGAIALWLMLAATGDSTVRCPLLNEATAAGILRGEVTSNVRIDDQNTNDLSCEYGRVGAPKSTLRVEVRTMKNWRTEYPSFLAQCGTSSTPVRGIGNDAVGCSSTAKDEATYFKVLSRVRERSLSVVVSADDKHVDPQEVRKQALQAADEVSGNLF